MSDEASSSDARTPKAAGAAGGSAPGSGGPAAEAPRKSLWSPDLELGIPLIDGQHRKLVGHLEDVQEAVVNGRPMREVADCLAFLQEYTEEHFRTEERFLSKYRFPGLEAHRLLHATFRGSVDKAARAVGTRLGADQSVQLIQSMVVHWYVDHIKGTDMQYANYLRAKGLIRPRE